MKKQENEVRKIFVKVRMNEDELEKLRSNQQRTTKRSISEYVRAVALQMPVTVKFRSQSTDDFLHEIIGLKKELNAVGNNFNQAVHKLHLLDKIPEFREWIKQYDGLNRVLINNFEEIKSKMNCIYEQLQQNDAAVKNYSMLEK
jgi:MobC-like protein